MAVQALLTIPPTLWILLICLGLGHLILGRYKSDKPANMVDITIRFALGFGILGNAVMVLGFLQLMRPLVLVGLLIAATALVARQLPNVFSLLNKAVLQPVTRTVQADPWPALWVLSLLCAYALRGLLPPSGFDALMYHLTTVKLYLQHGGFYDIAFNPQTDFPMLTEMVYSFGLALGNDSICSALDTAIGIAVAATIASVARTLLHQSVRLTLLSVLLFATSTVTIANMSGCDVDLAQALWTLLGVLCLLRYLDRNQRRYLFCAAFLTAMAVQTKIFGVFALPVMFAVLFVYRTGVRALGQELGQITICPRIRAALLLSVSALCLGAPWYLKSFFNTGSILSLPITPAAGQALAAAGPVNWLTGSLAQIFAAPWSFSLFPSLHRFDSFGPIPLAILPFLLITKMKRRHLWLPAAIAVYWAQILGMEILFTMQASIRYSLFTLIALWPLTTLVIMRLRNYRTIYRTTVAMCLCMCFLGSVLLLKRYHADWLGLLKNKSRSEYYASVLPSWPAIDKINSLPDTLGVLTVYDFDTYLLDKRFESAGGGFNHSADKRKYLIENGIGYIFANNRLDVQENMDAFPQIPGKTLIFEKNSYCVYRIDL